MKVLMKVMFFAKEFLDYVSIHLLTLLYARRICPNTKCLYLNSAESAIISLVSIVGIGNTLFSNCSSRQEILTQIWHTYFSALRSFLIHLQSLHLKISSWLLVKYLSTFYSWGVRFIHFWSQSLDLDEIDMSLPWKLPLRHKETCKSVLVYGICMNIHKYIYILLNWESPFFLIENLPFFNFLITR